MSFDDFINKWNTRGIDFDGAYGDQCMDLMHQYVVEVLGIADGRVLAAPAAKDVYLNFENIAGHSFFDKIANTPSGVPNKGDIVLWGTGIGPYGHVAIFQDGDNKRFRSFDQNFPTGSKCHTQDHDYTGVLGWLKFKGTASQSNGLPANYSDIIHNSTQWEEAVKYFEFGSQAKDTSVDQVKNTVGGYKSRITDLNNQVVSLQAEVDNRKEQLARKEEECQSERDLRFDLTKKLNDALKKANETSSVYEGEIAQRQALIDSLASEKGGLVKEIAQLKNDLAALKDKTISALTIADLLAELLKRITGR